jgi:hypothetical protein
MVFLALGGASPGIPTAISEPVEALGEWHVKFTVYHLVSLSLSLSHRASLTENGEYLSSVIMVSVYICLPARLPACLACGFATECVQLSRLGDTFTAMASSAKNLRAPRTQPWLGWSGWYGKWQVDE